MDRFLCILRVPRRALLRSIALNVVVLGPGRTTGSIVPMHLVERTRHWIDNHRKVKEHLEKISDINRELLRRERKKSKP